MHCVAALEHQLELLLVIRVGGDGLGDDHLRFAVHHRLPVVALDPAAVCF